MFLHSPLKRVKVTQPFGVDYLGNGGPGGKSYADIGLKNGHNGIDWSAPEGTELIAVCDGIIEYEVETVGYGKNARLFSKEFGVEVVYGHLSEFVGSDKRRVRAGEVIGLSGSTGFSTGPHLHLGIRPREWYGNSELSRVKFPNNGFFGYVDPTPYFHPDVFLLPVDKKYENHRPPTVSDFAPAFLWFMRTQKRLPSNREYNAMRYGYWDIRTVLDPAMFQTWSEMTKPAYIKKLNR